MKFLLPLFLAFFMSSAFATPSIQIMLVMEYPDARTNQINSCYTCHTPVVEGFLNQYGLDLKESGLNFKAIETVDSDLDGRTNIEEINIGDFPGSHATYPEYFVFNNKKGGVHFNHEAHVTEESYLSSGKCVNCHNDNMFPKNFNDNESVRQMAHKFCWKCHKESGSENAPTRCGDCHTD